MGGGHSQEVARRDRRGHCRDWRQTKATNNKPMVKLERHNRPRRGVFWQQKNLMRTQTGSRESLLERRNEVREAATLKSGRSVMTLLDPKKDKLGVVIYQQKKRKKETVDPERGGLMSWPEKGYKPVGAHILRKGGGQKKIFVFR